MLMPETIENVGPRGGHDVVTHAWRDRVEAPVAIMEIDDAASSFLLATLEGPKVGLAHRTDLLVQRELPDPTQQIDSGRLG